MGFYRYLRHSIIIILYSILFSTKNSFECIRYKVSFPFTSKTFLLSEPFLQESVGLFTRKLVNKLSLWEAVCILSKCPLLCTYLCSFASLFSVESLHHAREREFWQCEVAAQWSWCRHNQNPLGSSALLMSTFPWNSKVTYPKLGAFLAWMNLSSLIFLCPQTVFSLLPPGKTLGLVYLASWFGETLILSLAHLYVVSPQRSSLKFYICPVRTCLFFVYIANLGKRVLSLSPLDFSSLSLQIKKIKK